MTKTDTDNPKDLEPHNVTLLRENENETGFRTPPHNYEAEMALIGAILANNRSYEKVQEFLLPEHFIDPAHSRVYETCSKLIDLGQLADPVTLKNYFLNDETLRNRWTSVSC
jgi:replicative DNA helicase